MLSLHHNGDESYLHVNKTKIFKFKSYDNKFLYQFCLGIISIFQKIKYVKIHYMVVFIIFQLTTMQLKKEDILTIINFK